MRIALGVPILEIVPGREFYSLARLAAEISHHGTLVMPEALNLTPYSRGRNKIVDDALEVGCELVMFADADMTCPRGAFGALWSMMKAHSAAMVAGYAVRRGYPFSTVWEAVGGDCWSDSGPVELVRCGMGCNLIDLKWLKAKLEPDWFRMPEGGGTEDYPFCKRVRQAGGLILGHPGVTPGHKPIVPPVTAANAELYKRICEMRRADQIARKHHGTT